MLHEHSFAKNDRTVAELQWSKKRGVNRVNGIRSRGTLTCPTETEDKDTSSMLDPISRIV